LNEETSHATTESTDELGEPAAPDAALLLPRPLLRDLQPGWKIRLTVTFDPEPRLRLSYHVE
jgi:hypothetical protein